MSDSLTAAPGASEDQPVESRPRGLAAAQTGGDAGIAADAAVYTVAVYVAQGLLFVAGIVQKGILGPVGTGFWSLMQTFWTLLQIAPLGAFHGATRQIPMHRGRGDLEASAAVSDTGGSFSLLALAIVGTVLAAVAAIFGQDWAPEIRWGLVITGLTAPIHFFTDYHEVVFQATKKFRVVSVTEVVKAVVALTLTTGAVYLWGFYGMFVGALLAEVAIFATWVRMGEVGPGRPAFVLRIDRTRLRELVSFGAPIMVHGQIWVLFLAVDNLIVAGFLSVEQLGYYALAVSVTNYILYLPRSIGAVIFPRMTERFARSNDVESIRHFATDTQQLLAYLLVPSFMAAAFFLVPVLIRQALPEFEPAIPVVRIMVAASFFIALVNMPIKLLITTGYRWKLTRLMAACLLVNAAANVIAVAVFEWGLEGAAGATAFSYFATFVAMTVYALSRSLSAGAVLRQLAMLISVFLYVTATLWGVEGLIGEGGGGLVRDAAIGIAKVGIALLLLTPWFVLAERRYRGVSTIWRMVAGAGRRLAQRLHARS